MKLKLIGAVAIAALAVAVPAVVVPATAMVPPDCGCSLDSLRQDTVSRAWTYLNNPMGYQYRKADGTWSAVRSSSPVAYDYNYLGYNGSNDNHNQFNKYNGEAWCGDFAAATWTGVMKPNPANYPKLPTSYASSQQWRLDSGTRYHAYNTSAGKIIPTPGDVLVWQDGSGTPGVNNGNTQGHVGVVVSTYGSTVYTIEGNAGHYSDSIEEYTYSSWGNASGPYHSGKHFMGYVSRE